MKRKLNFILLFGILMTISMSVSAQLTMIKDMQTTLNNGGSNPTAFIEVKGILYFVATEPSIGTELWRTDGTTAGTQLVKDIRAGSSSSSPVNLVAYHDTLYFQADDGLYGRELWKSDGTENGTVMVMDIYPGSGRNGNNSSSPVNFIVYKDSLYFQARDGNGTELWVTGGSEEKTRMVKNIYEGTSGQGGANSSNPQGFVVVNNILFFTASSRDLAKKDIGRELWKCDGTTAGTVLVLDIYPGQSGYSGNSSNPKYLVGMNNKLYFAATTAANGEELWTSDGTASGTVLVKDIIAGTTSSTISKIVTMGSFVYFSAENGTDGVELWKSDGTATGTVMVQDLNTGSLSSYPDGITVFKGNLYFAADDGFNGFELYMSNGTTMTMVKDLNTTGPSSPYLFTICNNMLYFAAQNSSGNELWMTTGVVNNATRVTDINPGSKNSDPRDLTAFKNEVYFSAESGINGQEYSREPWKSNGTTTVMLKDIVSGTKPAYPSELIAINNILYFSAESTANANELFKYDGTSISIVKDILTGTPPPSSSPKHLINVNNQLYFTANDGNGYELWKSDGTAANTKKIKAINGGGIGSDPDSFCVIGTTLYFTANDGTKGFELYKTDGTATGTVMIKDIWVGAGSSMPYGLINVNGKLFFRANDSINGAELWTSDGTTGGTVMVKNINAGIKDSDPMNFYSFNNLCFFAADDGTNGVELWKSDGTATGTVMLKNIYTGTGGWGTPNSSNPQQFCVLNGYLYFQAAGNPGGTGVGRELWRTDGTDIGTTLVKDINPGSSGWSGAYSSTPMYLTKIGNTIYFVATTRNEGTELWKTDGTLAGTIMVQDINTIGKSSSNPNNLFATGNYLYFVAGDGVHGPELWKLDNNLCSKLGMTGEINAGNGGTGPSNLAAANGVLYFSASTPAFGSELWKYNNVFSYADTAVLTYSICGGDSVIVHNKTYKITGNFRDSLKTSAGCDSLILLKLTVNPKYDQNTNVQRCIGDSVLIQGIWRKIAGKYTDNLKTVKGCDSIVNVTLSFSVKPPKPTITKEGTATMVSSAATGNQWYDDSGPIAGQTGQKYSSTKNQKFYVIVTIDGCSSEPSNSFNPMKGSINDDIFRNINIYPNPVSDKFTIEFKDSPKGSYYFSINNMEGKEVLNGKLTETKNEIDVRNIPQGIYFVKIILGDKIGLIKIVRE